MKDPKEICIDCLLILLEHHRPTCQKIRSGKVKSRHHDVFKTGGKARNDLNFQCFSVRFCKTEDPIQIKHSLLVIEQELFIRIYADFMSLEYEIADRRFNGLDESTHGHQSHAVGQEQ